MHRKEMFFFGGENGSETSGMRNGLWRLSVDEKTTDGCEWTWMSGDKGYNGSAVYGKQPSQNNTPGARYAGQGWVLDNELFLFGGYGIDINGNAGYLSDTWSFILSD